MPAGGVRPHLPHQLGRVGGKENLIGDALVIDIALDLPPPGATSPATCRPPLNTTRPPGRRAKASSSEDAGIRTISAASPSSIAARPSQMRAKERGLIVEMRRDRGEQRGLEHVAVAEWIEPIPDIVGAAADRYARGNKLADERHAAPDRARLAAVLQEEIGRGQRHDGDLSTGEFFNQRTRGGRAERLQ